MTKQIMIAGLSQTISKRAVHEGKMEYCAKCENNKATIKYRNLPYCEECLNDKCDICDTTLYLDEWHTDESLVYCCDCFHERYMYCDRCEEYVLVEDMTQQDICKDCLQEREQLLQ
jgi:hypothetical protein